ncbi:MAG: BtpA family membrane complex biogenesis protein [Planctomyces sp.]|nr:BtpA family membrane complex biogenesis protein [Planctomyces sp.]
MLGRHRAVVGMIHLRALPGSPSSTLSVDRIAQHAADEARLLAEAGFDALMIENMHDRPYINAPHAPEVVAAMTAAGLAVRAAAPHLPLGVQVLSLGAREALAVAQAVGGSFVRVENFVFAHVADEGLMPTAVAGDLLRYRRAINAQGIAVLADVQKKHASHALSADVGLAQWAQGAAFFGADGLIVTGRSTGDPAGMHDVITCAGATALPVVVGSGVDPTNVREYFEHAAAVIVGSWYKRGGVWSEGPDPARCRALIAAARGG